MRRAIVWVAVAAAVLVGAEAAAGDVGTQPALELEPSQVAPGGSVEMKVDSDCRDSATIVFSIDGNGYDDDSDGFCAAGVFTGRMTAPPTPGTYMARANGQDLSLKAPLTVTATGGGSVCDQAIAEAGTGRGPFGEHELVFAPQQGGSGSQVIVGTEGDDRLNGGSGSDVLCGDGGDDVLTGGSGDDALYGGEGDDRVSGGAGEDSLDGGPGTDDLSGGSGDDVLLNGEDVDEGSGDDLVVAAPTP
jgi:Ca2+-binding RTX toxin-like protein